MRINSSLLRGALLLFILASFPLAGKAQESDGKLAALLDQAQVAQSSQNFGRAASLYRQATLLSPGTAELWSNRGVMEALSGQEDAAITSLRHALQLDPNLLPPMLFLGRAYVQSGKPALAVPLLRHAHALQPQDLEVQLTLGRAYLDSGKPELASLTYADATQIAPLRADAWFGLGVSSLHIIDDDASHLATDTPRPIWARALLADDLYAQGRAHEASATYTSVFAEATPQQAASLLQTLDWMSTHADALAIPQSSVGAIASVRAMESAHQTSSESACTASDRPTSSTRNESEAIEQAACDFWSGQEDQSARMAATALEHSPADPEALYWSIKANERLAVEALSRFETLSTHSAANFALVGNLFRLQRQPAKAMTEYQKALALDPHDTAALKGAVLASIDADNLDQAATLDKTALLDQPHDPELNLLLAEVLDTKGQETQEEETALANAAAVPSELRPRRHYLLARVAVREGRTHDAIEQYQLALPGDKDGSMHYQLSRLYRQTGDMAASQKALAESRTLIRQHDAGAAIALRDAEATNP